MVACYLLGELLKKTGQKILGPPEFDFWGSLEGSGPDACLIPPSAAPISQMPHASPFAALGYG